MRIFKWLLLFLPFHSQVVEAQFSYTFQNDVSVTEEDIVLSQPFSGGFVAPQYSAIDLDLDGIDDLFVFDRASSKVSTYLFKDGKYRYAPRYESLFPDGLKNWVLLRDYNCDGKKDLFTSSLFGMSLYENTSGTELDWVLKLQTIYTEGSNGQINLQISGQDLPAITDVDGDGDLDILNFNFATGGGIEFHKNMSIENNGICGIELVRTSRKYGDFEECNCDLYVFGVNECATGGREEHSGGKSLLSFNYSESEIQDLFVGQELCELTGYLPNTGTLELPKMERVSFDFPNANEPLRLVYPAFFEFDVFNNGSLDLVVAPNIYQPAENVNYETSALLYEQDNTGSYNLVTNEFLKNEMIDVGHKASPVFVDFDFDGDQDMLIGAGKNEIGASIWMYKNIGTFALPSFELETKDYLNIKEEAIESLRLQIFDVDGNGFPDLVLFKKIENDLIVEAYLHTGNPVTPYLKSNSTQLTLPSLSVWDSPHYFELGNKTGLLIGKQEGNLEYYTSASSPVSASWQLISSSYLAIEEDFTKRNLRIIVDDFNANNTQDMLSINDSGAVLIYENFLSQNSSQEIKGNSGDSNVIFSVDFGNLANPIAAKLYATLEPSLIFGSLQGGLHLLKNTQSTDAENKLGLNVIIYPNPVENNQVVLQSNKNSKARVLDVTGKEIIKPFELLGGEQTILQLLLDEGIYFVEVSTNDKEKEVTRIVIID